MFNFIIIKNLRFKKVLLFISHFLLSYRQRSRKNEVFRKNSRKDGKRVFYFSFAKKNFVFLGKDQAIIFCNHMVRIRPKGYKIQVIIENFVSNKGCCQCIYFTNNEIVNFFIHSKNWAFKKINHTL